MRFLIITKPKHLLPPEILSRLIDTMEPWRSTCAGKIEQAWEFAGIAGGGGIANVDSLEELDALMAEFPFGAISDVEIIPLVDLVASLQRMKQSIEEMVAEGAARLVTRDITSCPCNLFVEHKGPMSMKVVVPCG